MTLCTIAAIIAVAIVCALMVLVLAMFKVAREYDDYYSDAPDPAPDARIRMTGDFVERDER
jgi:hypothetical protein